MRLNEHEKYIIKQVLSKFGYTLGGGSSEIRDNGMIIYHMSIEKGSAATYGIYLGKKLQQALQADEVYDMGIRIA